MNRRQFLRTSGMGGIAFPAILNSAFSASPNGRLQHACIGLGNMGLRDFREFNKHEKVEVVALCDVDSRRLGMAAAEAPGARLYADWRELLEKESRRIDSVNVATPDHMHAPIGYRCLQAGKHMYLQKPLCHDVSEVRFLTEAAKKAGVVTQLGTQFASSTGDRMLTQLLQEEVIGQVTHVYLCENRENAIERYRLAGPRPKQGQQPPPEMNWDLYLGTAPDRPFAPDIYHQTLWRSWQDFGTGWLGDIGCHIWNASWRGLDLKAPGTVYARVQESWKKDPERFADTWPQTEHVTWTFPGNRKTGGEDLTVEWFDGEWFPPEEAQDLLGLPGRYPRQSAMVVGTEGALLQPHKAEPIMLPREKFKDFKKPELERQDHYRDFVQACVESTPSNAGFEVAGPLTEAVLLGTVAIRVPETTLTWDAGSMTITNHPKANRHLRRNYRDGWHVKGLG